MNNQDKYLRFEVIWKDEDMFELNIQAHNGRYSGTTDVYEVSDSLIEFAKELSGFPFGKDVISHSCGEKDNYASAAGEASGNF